MSNMNLKTMAYLAGEVPVVISNQFPYKSLDDKTVMVHGTVIENTLFVSQEAYDAIQKYNADSR